MVRLGGGWWGRPLRRSEHRTLTGDVNKCRVGYDTARPLGRSRMTATGTVAPAPTLAAIPCAEIVPSPDQNRETFDPDALAELAASIAETGQLAPIMVRPADGMLGGWVLIAGERRLRAIRDVLGRPTILAIIDATATAAGAGIGTLAENLVRRDTGPLEDAHGLARALELGHAADAAELARKLGKSPRWVAGRLALLELADDVAHWVAVGSLPVGRAVTMARLDVNRQRMALAAHEAGISPDGFAALCARLADDQAAETMFATDDFLRVAEYVADAEAAAVAPTPVEKVRELPYGIAEIAARFHVRPATVHKWRERGIFPAEDLRVGPTPAWWESTVDEWAANRKDCTP